MPHAHSLRAVLACAAVLALPALGQSTEVTGSFGGTGTFGTVNISFSCTGTPTCTGTYTLLLDTGECSNRITVTSRIVITGLNLTQPGALQGMVTFTDASFDMATGANRVCTIVPNTSSPIVAPYLGSWNGTSGIFTQVDIPNQEVHGGPPYRLSGTFKVTAPPVFAMTVTGSIDSASANIQAAIQFRPQDLGTTQSVFVFALAPASVVRPAASTPGEPAASAPKAETLPVGCVLAQLNSSGQLQQVSASDMKAFVTNTLTSQGLAITVLNGVPTVQIAGATFFVGYGSSASSMLSNGVNRGVATAPAKVQCKPEKPETGWWWGPAEGGRGYSLEVSGNTMFFASYLYDVSGRATWYAAAMPVSLDGAYYTGTLFNKAGGQMLDGAYRAPGPPVNAGTLVLAFNDATHGTLVWPGGSVPIERFDMVTAGHTLAPQPGVPESGWWWSPQEDGRGFYIEWQAGSAFIAGYMYDAAGNPLWYASLGTTPNPMSFQGSWQQYNGGQTLTGAYKPPAGSVNAGALGIAFSGPDRGMMTLPGGRTTSITRFRF